MNKLISVTEQYLGGGLISTVNARELHSFLESGRDFSTWIKDRIVSYGFVEDQDFLVFHENGVNPYGGRPNKNYMLSIDMAKELSMVERNAKGKQARQYFIECEKTAKKTMPAVPDFNDPAAAARAWADEFERRQLADKQRDLAIATKAQIGARREATAMNTASQAVKRVNKLESELGRCKENATLRAVHHMTGKTYDWLSMRKWCKRNGVKPMEVIDELYGSVKSWPAQAWFECHGVVLADVFGRD